MTSLAPFEPRCLATTIGSLPHTDVAFGPPLMIFLDEPSLLGFGSQTFIIISREDVIRDINEVVAAIHDRDALAGVHCEANTDWSLLMESDLDILDFDAYEHMQAMTLYPAELHAFFERGGSLGWGIVPTLDREAAASETIPSLLARFDEGLGRLVRKGFDRELLLRRALITPVAARAACSPRRWPSGCSCCCARCPRICAISTALSSRWVAANVADTQPTINP